MADIAGETKRAAASEQIAAVDVMKAINGDDLTDLPVGRYQKPSICLRYIRLPDDQRVGCVPFAEVAELLSEERDAV